MEWKRIEAFCGHYEASSDGRVRARDRIVRKPHSRTGKMIECFYPGKELSQHTNALGYKIVRFGYNGKRCASQVGRMVLMAFHGLPAPDHHCRHLNGDPTDNRAENLAWGTHLENMADRKAHGNYPQGDKHPGAKITNEQAMEIYLSNETGRALAERYGICETKISAIRLGHTWKDVTGGRPRQRKGKSWL